MAPAFDYNPVFRYYQGRDGVTHFYLQYTATNFTIAMTGYAGDEFFRILDGRAYIITNASAKITTALANERSRFLVYDGLYGIMMGQTESADAVYDEVFYGPWGPLRVQNSLSPIIQVADGFSEWSGNVSCTITLMGRVHMSVPQEPGAAQPVIVEKIHEWPWLRH